MLSTIIIRIHLAQDETDLSAALQSAKTLYSSGYLSTWEYRQIINRIAARCN